MGTETGSLNDKDGFLLTRNTLQRQVADEMERMIVEGKLDRGQRLPSERELEATFGVSRSVIREALNTLSTRGLVDIKHGSGTYVRAPELNQITEPMSRYLKLTQAARTFDNLFEVRFALEVEIAGLAAQRVTDNDIAELREILAHMREQEDVEYNFVRYDLRFHAALARLSRNELFEALLEPITDLSLKFREAAYEFDRHSSIEGALYHHSAILDQIAAHDENGARAAMRAHLMQAYELYQRAKREQPSRAPSDKT